MEGGGGDGQFGEVESLEERVVGTVDLEQPETTVRSSREENLSARVEADLDNGALIVRRNRSVSPSVVREKKGANCRSPISPRADSHRAPGRYQSRPARSCRP